MTRQERKQARNARFAEQAKIAARTEQQKQEQEAALRQWMRAHPVTSGLVRVVDYQAPRGTYERC